MSVHDLILTDRSRIVCDWVCPRKRYWNYEHANRGVVKTNESIYIYLGTVIHDALAAIAHHQLDRGEVDINDIASKARIAVIEGLLGSVEGEIGAHAYAQEQGALTEGLIRGFYRQVWPSLMKQYPKIVSIEQEMEYKIADDILFMSKPDLILEDEDGEWHYIEYKSTASKKNEWIDSWNTAVQLHSTVRAVEATLGKAPVDVTVVGLYKGYVSYGKQNSPFCYAYRKAGNPPFTQDQVRYEFTAGFKRSPVWELEGGVAKWVSDMPSEMLLEQFPCTPPIYIKDDLVDAFFKQVAIREGKISDAIAINDMDAFPQKFSECSPAWGSGCPYRQLCHGPQDVDPIEMGYVYRESHHEREAKQDEGV